MKTSQLLLALAALLPLQSQSLAGEKSLTGMQVYENGKAALDRGDLVTARRCFEQLLKAKPDFELAKIQLAQVVVAERELAKFPKVMKVARTALLPQLKLDGVPLEDAAAAVAQKLEAAAGREGGPVNLTCGTLPADVRGRSVTLSVSQAKFDHVLQALGYNAGVQFTYTLQGLSVREDNGSRVQFDAGDPKEADLSGAAGKVVIDRIVMKDADLSEALAFLERKAAEVSGGQVKPIFVVRHGAAPRGTVTLDLRSTSLRDAVDAVCLVADCEARWFPWGAGIGNRQAAAAETGTAVKAATAAKPQNP